MSDVRVRDADVLAAAGPYVLLAASFAIATAFTWSLPEVFPAWTRPWQLLLIAATILLRAWWDRTGGRPAAWRTGFWAAWALCLGLVLLSPFYGLYAFHGYLDAARRPTGVRQWPPLVATAAVCALAQSGGPRAPLFTPAFYALFLGVNLVIVWLLGRDERRRGRHLDEARATNEELRRAHERNAALQQQLVAQAREAGIADERSRLSREIHDTVAQDLVAIITQLEALKDAVDADERDRRLAAAEAGARDALAEARRAVHALASPRLDVAELPLALDDLLGQWRESSGAAGELRVAGDARPGTHDDVLLRVAQECLSNVARHARASNVLVDLAYADADVTLRVRDDGVGFDPAAPSAGFGLSGMRERVARARGAFEVHSRPGGGTCVVATIPGRRS